MPRSPSVEDFIQPVKLRKKSAYAKAHGAIRKIDIETPDNVKNDIYKMFNIDHDPVPVDGLKYGPDALDRNIPWGKNNYINPPFNKSMVPIIIRAIEEKEKGNSSYILVPFRPISKYYQRLFLAATDITLLSQHLKFKGYDSGYPFALAIYHIESGKEPLFKHVALDSLKFYQLNKK